MMTREEVLEQASESVALFRKACALMTETYNQCNTEDDELLNEVFNRANVHDTLTLSFDEMLYGLGAWQDELELEKLANHG